MIAEDEVEPRRTSAIGCLTIVVIAFIWAAMVRGPYISATAIDGDEALFWIIGRAWSEGHVPYTQFWDVKPPGIFLIFAGVAALFGNSIVGAKVLAIAAVGTTASGLYVFGERHLKSRTAGRLAALIFPPYTLLLDGLASKTELYIAPFVIWAVTLLLLSVNGDVRRRFLYSIAAGILFGFAATIKQTACFELAFAVIYASWIGRSWRLSLALLAGAAIPVSGFCLYFSSVGALPAMLQACVLGALGRLHGDGISIGSAPLQSLAQLKPALPLLAGACLLWAERRRFDFSTSRAAVLAVAIWLAAASAGMLVMRATYPAYALPLLAPLSLLTSVLVDNLRRGGGRTSILIVGGVIAVLVYPFIFFQLSGGTGLAGSDLPRRISDYVKRIAPGQPIFVVDYEPVVYQLAEAPILTRYPLPEHLICDFPALPVSPEAEIARVMAARPAIVVISANRKRMVCEASQRAELAIRLGGPSYVLDRRFSNAIDVIEIWRRKDIVGAIDVKMLTSKASPRGGKSG